jgi:16S rRNA (cytidine1402-2'-O)-methyltransferase
VLSRTLYVVATPLGNLRDITLRALDTLSGVDCIAAEDTRVSATLLARYGISVPMLSLHEHNEARRASEIVALLQGDKAVALITDAGTPAISDPGALLVRTVADAGFDVVPVPGASAVATALSVAGTGSERWLFAGFLPAKASARRTAIKELAQLPFALVLYESPHRIEATLKDLAAGMSPDRPLVIARELTKHFESIHRCRLGDANAWITGDRNRQRGEFVLVLDEPEPVAADAEVDHKEGDRLLAALLAEVPVAQAVRIAVAFTGAPRNSVYARALEMARPTDEENG